MTRQDSEQIDVPVVMVVDDDPAVVAQTVRALQSAGYRTISADSGPMAITISAKFIPHVLLVDLDMPLVGGIEVCREIRSRSESCDTPIIFLNDERLSQERLTRCLDAGGHDYLIKPVDESELLTRVHVALRERTLRDAYRRLAIEDPVTRLANRRQTMQEIKSAMDLAAVQAEQSQLLLCDVDHLADINNRFGYDLGDEVILTLSRLLRRLVSPDIKAGRIGGEEFILLMSRTAPEFALSAAQSLQRTFSAIVFDAVSDPKHFSVSIGLASYAGRPEGFTVDRFLAQADLALAVAKSKERDRVAAYWQLDPHALPKLDSPQRHARLGVRQCRPRSSISPAAESQIAPPKVAKSHDAK
jgi:diguanylate cyclase (GGDEF)-like protein